MKTYEQFRTEILKSEAFQKMTIQELETTAAKEYAKQWVTRAGDKALFCSEGDEVDAVLSCIEEIEKQ